MPSRRRFAVHAAPAAVAALAGLASSVALAQVPATPPSRQVPVARDSGPLAADPRGAADQVVYETFVFVPDAQWLRLSFGAETSLAGAVEEGRGAYLRLTSLQDGAEQTLTSETLAQWSNSSAFFNGDAVKVELIARPGAGPSRLTLTRAEAGEAATLERSICGPVDDRVLSFDDRMGRHSVGCTAWMFNDANNQFLTAGHCTTSGTSVVSFKVPLSTATGTIVNPPPSEQYAVDAVSNQGANGGIGNDWRYFGVFPNSQTGLMPIQAYNAGVFTIQTAPVLAAGQTIRITGYGTTASPVTPTWNQVQKTHTGARVGVTSGIANQTLEYQPDTTGGNSGSPVVWENAPGGADQIAIGIHTHAGCVNPLTAAGNRGTHMFNVAAFVTALNAPRGVCLTGRGTPGGPLFAAGDAVNNVGTLSTSSGAFAKVGFGPAGLQGLTYDWNAGTLLAVNLLPVTGVQRLVSINPASGAVSTLATLSGNSSPINGLGFDPASGSLYGVSQGTGQLWRINRTTGACTAVGAPASGTTIGALEFDPNSGVLFGIDDAGGASRLVRISTGTGAVTLVGALGAGIADCNGLAVTDDGQLWTINAATEQLLRIDRATGAATVVGPTAGLFGSGFGMAAALTRPTAACYANCDGSTSAPALNALDFGCFLNRYVAGDAYANCDGSTSQPVLNALDFSCFLGRYQQGCR